MVIYGTTSNQYITATIEWSFTQDIDANTSTVSATLYYRRTNSGYTTSGTGDFTITIDGQSTTAKSKQMAIGTSWVKAVSATKTISHNSDGSKTITISASGGMSGTTLTSTSCSGTFDLTTIPRASAITSVYGGTLGYYCHVTWTPLSTSFRYKLKFTLGDWSDTTEAIHPNVNFGHTYDYNLPLDVANQLPNAKTGTMTVTLYTYSDSAATTQVGSASSKTFTVTILNTSTTQPTVSMSLTPAHSLNSKFASVYVQGKSKVQATLSAEGKYGASIDESSYKMAVLGKTDSSSPYQSDYLTTAGTVEVTGYATDSRGFAGTKKQSITVIPYSKPKIIPASGDSSIICARCDANGNLSESGTYLKIKAKRSYSKVESGTQLNFCAIRYRCKPSTNASFTDADWVIILAKNSTIDEIATDPIANVVADESASYIVEVGVVDDIGESSSLKITIPTSSVDFHLREGGGGAAFGKYAEKEKCLEVSADWSVKFDGITMLKSLKFGSTTVGGSAGDAEYYKLVIKPAYHHKCMPVFLGIEAAEGDVAVAWVLHIDPSIQYCTTLYRFGADVVHIEPVADESQIIIYVKGAKQYVISSTVLLEIVQSEEPPPDTTNNGILKLNTI